MKKRSLAGRVARWSAIVAGSLLALVLAMATYVTFAPERRYAVPSADTPVAVTAERIERGREIFRVRCLDCHVDPGTGRASGRVLTEIPAVLGRSHSANITSDRHAGIGAWTDGQLIYTLRTGIARDGRLLAPWMPRLNLMADEDVRSVVAFLRSGDDALRPVSAPAPHAAWSVAGRALMRFVWRPTPVPSAPIDAPAIADRVAYGRYFVQAVADCWTCHSASFAGLDRAHPERSRGYLAGGNVLHDAAGASIPSSNITPDRESGIGRWSESDMLRALREGVRPDGPPLRYPMPRYDGFDDRELSAAYAYLRTVPAVRTEARTTVASSARTDGRALYERYACRSCHGDDGIGIADLRRACTDFPTDAELEAWIRHPSRIRPGTRMPDFDGIVRDEDMPALVRFVRELSAGTN